MSAAMKDVLAEVEKVQEAATARETACDEGIETIKIISSAIQVDRVGQKTGSG